MMVGMSADTRLPTPFTIPYVLPTLESGEAACTILGIAGPCMPQNRKLEGDIPPGLEDTRSDLDSVDRDRDSQLLATIKPIADTIGLAEKIAMETLIAVPSPPTTNSMETRFGEMRSMIYPADHLLIRRLLIPISIHKKRLHPRLLLRCSLRSFIRLEMFLLSRDTRSYPVLSSPCW